MIIVEGPQPVRIDREAWTPLAIGTGLALLASVVPLLRFVCSYLTILVHEMGHALTAWLFGYPAIPTFDLRYGGGVTLEGERAWPLVLIPLALLAWLAWRHRSNPSAPWAWSGLGLIYLGLAVLPIHRELIIAMGHGTELIIAGIFVYRALSGAAIKIPAERPLYAACGMFIVFESLRFGWRLASSAAARREYAQAKGGGHWMDFSRLAGEFEIREQVLASGFLVCALAVPVLAWLGARYREYVREFVQTRLGA